VKPETTDTSEQSDLIKNFLARIGCLTVIALTAFGAWHYREAISASLGRVEIGISSTEPSEGLARRAEEKLLSLSTSESADVSLSEAELQSLLTFRVAPQLPAGIEQPLIEFRDSMMIVSAVILPDRLDAYAPPEMMRQFIADSARVAATLVPGLRRPGTGQITVNSLQAGTLVIPAMMVPFVLQGIEIPGVDASGSDLLVPLPARVSAIDLEGGEVMIRLRAAGD
jgi:hypothetical protein